MFRRSWSYHDGLRPDGSPDAGLLFTAWQRDPRTAFVPVPAAPGPWGRALPISGARGVGGLRRTRRHSAGGIPRPGSPGGLTRNSHPRRKDRKRPAIAAPSVVGRKLLRVSEKWENEGDAPPAASGTKARKRCWGRNPGRPGAGRPEMPADGKPPRNVREECARRRGPFGWWMRCAQRSGIPFPVASATGRSQK
ncbi:hypothetical protein [Streptomyces sp. NPDC090298]|uniref:hypothetical protein n=1 Tax=Streptomyces sp. NPDC090298 TaxID=3365959 RepID=UPI00382675F9